MVQFNVPDDIAVDDFFNNYVGPEFKKITAGVDLSSMAGTEFTLQFNIDDYKYCLKMTNGSGLEVIDGGVDNPMLTLAVKEDAWRDAITGKIAGTFDRFIDPLQIADKSRYSKLLATRGTLNLELNQEDDSMIKASLIFNNADTPAMTINLKLSDWVAMQNKEVDGTALFLGGKMKTNGDLMFLMGLQALL